VRYAIGIDVGGTTLKGGLVDEAGKLLFTHARPTPIHGATPPDLVAALVELSVDLRSRARGPGIEPEGIGFGQPNIIDGPDWVQRQVNNLPYMEGFALRPALAEALGGPLAMDNDVMNASLAEYHFGDGHNYERAFYFSLGTGIAAGIFTEGGRQLRYTSGWTGDTGHIIVEPHGEACTCGGRGCLETVATGPAIRRRAMALAQSGKSGWLASRLASNGDLTPADVTEAAMQGDSTCVQVWQEVGWYVGIALTSYLHVFDPHVILVGGGLAQAGDLLLSPIRSTLNSLGSPYYLAHLQAVKQAALGPEAGIIGAAALILLPEGFPST
jgi:glucokinase